MARSKKMSVPAGLIPTAKREQPQDSIPTEESKPVAKQGRKPNYYAPAKLASNSAFDKLAGIRGLLEEGVMSGSLPVLLSPEQIIDEVGSDRIQDLPAEAQGKAQEEFDQLVQNIKKRGQRQPIWVRPVSPDWEPNPNSPQEIQPEAQFALQSGRRRLAACKTLGRQVAAFISTEISRGARVSDLEERYFENTARKDLSPFEKLLSVGMIYKEQHQQSKKNQEEVAEELGISQGTVSLGFSCLQLLDQFQEAYGDRLTELTQTEIKAIVTREKRRLKGREPEEAKRNTGGSAQNIATEISAAPLPLEIPLKRGGKLKIKTRAKGLTLAVDGLKLSEGTRERFTQELTALLERYENDQ
ncbi:ParB/RepB/Spo0J family partition protein [Tranquillimonas alkanivorans]|uniref:ParB/RepB/Spo0J family partition protein n=1 Tax=Tranquillimonas alkanivorans TaxID=441119 RepID=A0A1I5W2N5_9RHOB|nr:ParB N-terminal domain-containing protein [Tranquillimonas alkanivorans]SFQ14034.1 ParB/RepB/Spo0J family partition protein [Tranquillimonas alkanivorans]